MGSFVERTEELQERVGQGKLTVRGVVHQPYAAAEHNKIQYKHPRGGGPGYLSEPFEAGHGEQLQILADGVLEDIHGSAIEAVGKFSEWVRTHAPVEFDVLRESTNEYVEDNGMTVYEKPQEAPYESWKE